MKSHIQYSGIASEEMAKLGTCHLRIRRQMSRARPEAAGCGTGGGDSDGDSMVTCLEEHFLSGTQARTPGRPGKDPLFKRPGRNGKIRDRRNGTSQ
jgi:hypothetical protein